MNPRPSGPCQRFDPAYLRERLRYDPETGKLWWRFYEPHGASWNTRWAGKEAFTAQSDGYHTGSIDSRTYEAHRVIWAMVHDEWPEEIDHEDHDRAHNRLHNLRAVGRVGNGRNLPLRSTNTTGVTGVSWASDRDKWHAYIEVERRRVHLGHFDDFDAAVAARKAAEFVYNFHPNHGTPT